GGGGDRPGGARGSARDLRLGRPLPVPGSVPVRVVTAPEQSALFEDAGGDAERLTPEQARAVGTRAGSRPLHAHAGGGEAAAGVDPGFRVLDEAEAARLRAAAFEAAFAVLLDVAAAAGDDALELAAAYRPARLSRLIEATYAQLRSRGQTEPVLPAIEATAPGEAAAARARLAAARDAAAARLAAERDGAMVRRAR